MTSHNTWIHVSEDLNMDAVKIHVNPPSMAMMISKSELGHAYPGLMAKKVAQQLGDTLAKEVEKQIHDLLLPMTPKGMKWDKFDADPMADLKAYSDVLKDQEHDLLAQIMNSNKVAMAKQYDEILKQKYLAGSSSGSFEGYNPTVAIWDEISDYTPNVVEQEGLGTSVTKMLYDAIPGFDEMRQGCPQPGCGTTHRKPYTLLRDTIIHLNDWHNWSRERIADWLETLDHDLTFKTPEEVNANAGHDNS